MKHSGDALILLHLNLVNLYLSKQFSVIYNPPMNPVYNDIIFAYT